jgi:hypothetical protein
MSLDATLSQTVPKADDAAIDEAWVGRVIAGRYALLEILGRGGMGVVFAARHAAVGRDVAVKILRAEVARNPNALTRFQREARAAASITHSRVVQVIDFGSTAEGIAYLVMERLRGEDLSALIAREGKLSVERTVRIAAQIADGLSAAHQRSVVHRDLKSANVFVSMVEGRESVKVLDFGVSKVLDLDDDDAPSTHRGSLVGTPHYMAPEQVSDGRSVDHRVDLYALGCMIFEMLAGERPFTGATHVEVLYKQTYEVPRKPSVVRGDKEIPRALDDLVLQLLAKDRTHRPVSATAVATALRAVTQKQKWRPSPALVAVVCIAATGLLAWRLTPAPQNLRHEDTVAHASVPRVDVVTARDESASDVREAAVSVREVVLTLVVRPEDTLVTVNGERVASPDGVLVQRAHAGDVLQLRAQKAGHAVRDEEITLRDDVTLRWTLSALQSRSSVVRSVRMDAGVERGVQRSVPPDGLKASPYRR